MYKLGDIVVNKRSQAKTLKAKIYKVIERSTIQWSTRWVVVNPQGRRRELREWDMCLLTKEVANAQRRLVLAQELAQKRLRYVNSLQNDLDKVHEFFPPI